MSDLQSVKTSVGWLELAPLTSNPTDTNSSRYGLAIVSGVLKAWTGSEWSTVGGDGGGTGSLDSAYDAGSTITVDTGAVQFAGATGLGSGNVFNIRNTGAGTGNMIDIENASSGTKGKDIIGTGNTWDVTAVGVATFVGIFLADDTTLRFGNTAASPDATINYDENGSDTLQIAGATSFVDSVLIDGTATNTVFTITAGDAALSDGQLSIEDADNDAPTLLVTNDTMTTYANATDEGLVHITSASLTTGNALQISLDEGELDGGKYIQLWQQDADGAVWSVGEGGTTAMAGLAAGTAALTVSLGDFIVTDTDASKMSSVNGTGDLLILDNEGGVIGSDNAVLYIDAGGAVASGGNLLRVVPSGTPNAGAIGMEFVGAGKLLTALYIDADPTASSVAQIQGGGALTADLAVLVVSSDGALATGANTFRVDTTGTPASGAIYAEFDFAGITDTHENIGVKIDAGGKKVIGLHVDADPIANDVVYLHSDAVIAADKAVINVTSAGAIASGGNAMRVDVTGTPASGAVYVEYDFAGLTDTHENVGLLIDATAKKVQALKIIAAPVAGSVALITAGAALAADKAALELVGSATGSDADSAVLRVTQDHLTGASFCVNLKQDDLDVGFINFEGTASADANSPISTSNTTGTVTDFVRCAINGTKAWIAVSTNDPT